VCSSDKYWYVSVTYIDVYQNSFLSIACPNVVSSGRTVGVVEIGCLLPTVGNASQFLEIHMSGTKLVSTPQNGDY
jgi:hypothetical protein